MVHRPTKLVLDNYHTTNDTKVIQARKTEMDSKRKVKKIIPIVLLLRLNLEERMSLSCIFLLVSFICVVVSVIRYAVFSQYRYVCSREHKCKWYDWLVPAINVSNMIDIRHN